MEKDALINNYNHGISLVERKNLVVSGVKKIDSFDNEQFLMDTVMGILLVKGENLELIKLDTMQGNVSIKGLVNSMTYLEDGKTKSKENSILNRLFK
ncbi:MAG: sporulation protein YabP [Bacilli bacterium]|nr:sporulation protein YabP [Bacilli bacterium]